MTQITIHRKPDAPVETINGTVRWDEHLEAMADVMTSRGRRVEIRAKRITGDLALWADVPRKRGTIMNVRTLEE